MNVVHWFTEKTPAYTPWMIRNSNCIDSEMLGKTSLDANYILTVDPLRIEPRLLHPSEVLWIDCNICHKNNGHPHGELCPKQPKVDE